MGDVLASFPTGRVFIAGFGFCRANRDLVGSEDSLSRVGRARQDGEQLDDFVADLLGGNGGDYDDNLRSRGRAVCAVGRSGDRVPNRRWDKGQ